MADNSQVEKRQEEETAELKWRRPEDEVALKLQGLEEEAATFEFSIASAPSQVTINLTPEVITDNRQQSNLLIKQQIKCKYLNSHVGLFTN